MKINIQGIGPVNIPDGLTEEEIRRTVQKISFKHNLNKVWTADEVLAEIAENAHDENYGIPSDDKLRVLFDHYRSQSNWERTSDYMSGFWKGIKEIPEAAGRAGVALTTDHWTKSAEGLAEGMAKGIREDFRMFLPNIGSGIASLVSTNEEGDFDRFKARMFRQRDMELEDINPTPVIRLVYGHWLRKMGFDDLAENFESDTSELNPDMELMGELGLQPTNFLPGSIAARLAKVAKLDKAAGVAGKVVGKVAQVPFDAGRRTVERLAELGKKTLEKSGIPIDSKVAKMMTATTLAAAGVNSPIAIKLATTAAGMKGAGVGLADLGRGGIRSAGHRALENTLEAGARLSESALVAGTFRLANRIPGAAHVGRLGRGALHGAAADTLIMSLAFDDWTMIGEEAGEGFFLGAAGAGRTIVGEKINPIRRQEMRETAVKNYLSGKSPEEAIAIVQAYNGDVGGMLQAASLEIFLRGAHAASGSDIDIIYMSQDEYTNEVGDHMANTRGVKILKEGRPLLIINADLAIEGTSLHEGMHGLLDLDQAATDSKGNSTGMLENPLRRAILGTFDERGNPEGGIYSREELADLERTYKGKLGVGDELNAFEKSSPLERWDMIFEEIAAEYFRDLMKGRLPNKRQRLEAGTFKQVVNERLGFIARGLAAIGVDMSVDGEVLDRFGNPLTIDSPLFGQLKKSRQIDRIIIDYVNAKNKATKRFASDPGSDKKIAVTMDDIAGSERRLERAKGRLFKVDENGEILKDASGRPVAMTARERNKADKEANAQLAEILQDDDGETSTRLDEQALEELDQTPDGIISSFLKHIIRKVNESVIDDFGKPFRLNYYAALKGGKYSSKISMSTPLVTFLSISKSEAGNIVATTFEIEHYNRKIQKHNSTAKGRKTFELWNGDTHAFDADVRKLMENHRQGRPGKTDLDPNSRIANQKAQAIFTFLGVKDEGGFESGGGKFSLVRRRRLDRISDISEVSGSSYAFQYGDMSRRFEQGDARHEPTGEATVTVAPYRNAQASTIAGAEVVGQREPAREFGDTINQVIRDLGLSQVANVETVGGWFDTDVQGNIVEPGRSITIDNADPVTIRGFAALIGSLAPDVQQAVYLSEYDDDGPHQEVTIPFESREDAEKASERLDDYDLGAGFTLDLEAATITIGVLDNEGTDKVGEFAKATGARELEVTRAHISFPGEGEYREALKGLRASGEGNTSEAAQRTNLAIDTAEARLDAREQERVEEARAKEVSEAPTEPRDPDDESTTDQRFEPGEVDPLGMFSQAERVAQNLSQKKGQKTQMLTMMKKAGVTNEEIIDTGLDKFLGSTFVDGAWVSIGDEGLKKVTLAEIQEHLLVNQIVVTETVLGDRTGKNQFEAKEVPDTWPEILELAESLGWDAELVSEYRAINESIEREMLESGELGNLDPESLLRSRVLENAAKAYIKKIEILDLAESLGFSPQADAVRTAVDTAQEESARQLKNEILDLAESLGWSPDPTLESGILEENRRREDRGRGEELPADAVWTAVDAAQVESALQFIKDEKRHVEPDQGIPGLLRDVGVEIEGPTKFDQMRNLVVPGAEPGSQKEIVLRLPPRKNKEETFSGHAYSGENDVAWIRLNIRTIDGKRVLFIEEIQSDWHQKGRKLGYKGQPLKWKETMLFRDTNPSLTAGGYRISQHPAQAKEFTLHYGETGRVSDNYDSLEEAKEGAQKDILGVEERLETLLAENIELLDDQEGDELDKRAQIRSYYKAEKNKDEIVILERTLKGAYSGTVPDAAFKKSWPELAMKRMLKYAADNGLEGIGWTTGKTQSRRYDMSEYFTKIEWDVDVDYPGDENDRYSLIVHQKGTDAKINKRDLTAKELEETIGKEHAERIIKSVAEGTFDGLFEGLDLEVDDTSLKRFYDQELRWLKILKRLKLEPRTETINEADGDVSHQVVIDGKVVSTYGNEQDAEDELRNWDMDHDYIPFEGRVDVVFPEPLKFSNQADLEPGNRFQDLSGGHFPRHPTRPEPIDLDDPGISFEVFNHDGELVNAFKNSVWGVGIAEESANRELADLGAEHDNQNKFDGEIVEVSSAPRHKLVIVGQQEVVVADYASREEAEKGRDEWAKDQGLEYEAEVDAWLHTDEDVERSDAAASAFLVGRDPGGDLAHAGGGVAPGARFRPGYRVRIDAEDGLKVHYMDLPESTREKILDGLTRYEPGDSMPASDRAADLIESQNLTTLSAAHDYMIDDRGHGDDHLSEAAANLWEKTFAAPFHEGAIKDYVTQALVDSDHGLAYEEGNEEAGKAIADEAAEAAGLPLVGVNINDSSQDFTGQILAGTKTVETRNSENNALANLVGDRIGIVRTGKGAAEVVGYATVGEPIRYRTEKEFAADVNKHQVRGGKFGFAGFKIGYPLADVESVTPFSVPAAKGVVKTRPIHAPFTFYEEGDPEVASGEAQVGDLIPISKRFDSTRGDSRFEPGDAMPMSSTEVLYSKSESPDLSKPTSKRSNSAVAKKFQAVAKAYWGKVINSTNITAEQRKIIIENGIEEAVAALDADEEDAADWYTADVKAAISIMAVIHPELTSEKLAIDAGFPNSETAQLGMFIAMAITSQNLNVDLNSRFAEEQYGILSSSGKFDSTKIYGDKAQSISGNLDLANKLVKALGWEGAKAFVSPKVPPFTVRGLEAAASEILGEKITIAGRKDDIVEGAAIFGPKIGQGFLQNLLGNFDPVTIDLWLRRTWGRWTGDVLGESLTDKRLARILDAVRAANQSGLKLPDHLKNIRPVTRTNESGNEFRTISRDVQSQIENDEEFVAKTMAWSKELAARWQAEYRALRVPTEPQVLKDLVAGKTTLKAVAKKNRAVIKKVNDEYKKKKPSFRQGIKLVEFRDERLVELGFTEIIPAEIISDKKPQWAYASTTLANSLKPIDIPSNQDRQVISEIINEIRRGMEDLGHTLTNADVQAILWYPEKDVWSKLRGEGQSKLKSSYVKEFQKLAEALGLGKEAEAAAEKSRRS